MSTAQVLNLGNIISKGEPGSDSLFFLEEETEHNEVFQVNADLLATGRTCVIGSSGSGKSYTVGVICEELCKNSVPFVIIDVEGEYSGLKEKYEAIWVGDHDNCDLKWRNSVDLKALAQHAPDCPPIIFDVSEADRPREKVSEFLVALYREISRRRSPYLVILEEADRFSPQVGDRLAIFDEIARRGRKRGLGFMLCTQRPSLVDKNVLSQCSNQLIGKLVIKNDLRSVAQFFSGTSLPNQLTTLSSGEFFALGGLSQEPARVKIRTRETRHGGMTPKLNPTAVRASVERIIESLEKVQPAGAQEIVIPPPTALVKFSEQKPRALAKVETPAPNAPELEDEGEMSESLPEDIAELEPVQSNKILGLAPLIETESVPALLRTEKSHKLFGQKENVTRVGLGFRPLVEVAVRTRTGLLKKKFETKYFFLDGVSGKLAEVTDRLTFKPGVERLLSLEEGQIGILRVLHPDKDLSLIEIASASKRLEDDTRRLLKGLEDKRLVRSRKVGRAKMFRRLVDVPRIDLFDQTLLKLNELNEADGFKLTKLKIKESQVREFVKGMWDGADVDNFRQFYYPVYLAELVLKGRNRYVWIDGRTGKEIEV